MIKKIKEEILFILGAAIVTVLSHLTFSSYFSDQSFGMLFFALLIGYSLRAFFTKLFTLHIMLVAGLIFYGVSNIKLVNMGRVIEGRDLLYLGQATDVSDYLPWVQILLALLLLGSLLVHKKRLKMNIQFVPLFCIVFCGVIFYSKSSVVFANTNSFLQRSMNVHLDFWSSTANLETNGIFLHLLQTSPTSILPKAGEHSFYSKRAVPVRSSLSTPDIFYVICESCFYSNSSESPFNNSLKKLEALGLVHFEMVSPTYGGGTSEAEFELLTGLPASGLVGIKYQVYGGSFSDTSKTLARELLNSGYRTFFMHNTPASHWRRYEVVPKFGFEEQYYIDSMTDLGDERWARDKALYSKALEKYREELQQPFSKPVFMNLLAVYSHGGYGQDELMGVGNFNKKIEVVVDDFIAFYNTARKVAADSGRETVFIVIGDHKPALLEAFEAFGEIPSSAIQMGVGGGKSIKNQLNSEEKIAVGRMPIFISKSLKEFVSRDVLSEKPFFCLPSYINLLSINSSKSYLESVRFYCESEKSLNMNDDSILQKIFVQELYSENLFE